MTKATVYFIRDVQSGKFGGGKHYTRFTDMDEVFMQRRFITHKPTAVRVLNELNRYGQYCIVEDGEDVWYAANQEALDRYAYLSNALDRYAYHSAPRLLRIPQFELVEVEVDFSFSEGVVIKGKS